LISVALDCDASSKLLRRETLDLCEAPAIAPGDALLEPGIRMRCDSPERSRPVFKGKIGVVHSIQGDIALVKFANFPLHPILIKMIKTAN
jgi:hypothetical protein